MEYPFQKQTGLELLLWSVRPADDRTDTSLLGRLISTTLFAPVGGLCLFLFYWYGGAYGGLYVFCLIKWCLLCLVCVWVPVYEVTRTEGSFFLSLTEVPLRKCQAPAAFPGKASPDRERILKLCRQNWLLSWEFWGLFQGNLNEIRSLTQFKRLDVNYWIYYYYVFWSDHPLSHLCVFWGFFFWCGQKSRQCRQPEEQNNGEENVLKAKLHQFR